MSLKPFILILGLLTEKRTIVRLLLISIIAILNACGGGEEYNTCISYQGDMTCCTTYCNEVGRNCRTYCY
jgi:hypothetical protein